MTPPTPPLSARLQRLTVAFILFGGVGLVFLFGLPLLGLSGPALAGRALALARGPAALPVVVATFAALAFLGVPQVALIAACVAAFGPRLGFAYSWIGTLVSALVGFGLGRIWSARLIAVGLPPRVARFAELIGRNGFVASLAVRLVPFAPFVAVNMAAGVTRMSLAAFVFGTGLGIAPKIAAIAFAGGSIMSGGGRASLAWVALAALVWLGAGLAAARWLRGRG
jgi:uncharacterized membrane protein YdjX (TVP38/TMEM64 family)